MATQPLEAPGARTATQPVQALVQSLMYSHPVRKISVQHLTVRVTSKVLPVPCLMRTTGTGPQTGTSLGKRLQIRNISEEASYRQTMRGVRSFMGWQKIPEFETVSSSDDNPIAGARVQPTGKVSVKLPVDDWLCRKMDKLNLTITEGYPARNTDTSGLLKDQFVKPPKPSRWYGMHADRGDSDSTTVYTWSPEPAKLNHSFSRVAHRSFPSAPPSRAFSQDMLRRWERTAREQTLMCNQAAGLSRCLTRVQDTTSTQLKSLHLDTKGKSVDELDYLVTFNGSISQAMARTMQDLSEGVFIYMSIFTLACRDSYLEYLHAGVKHDTLNALRTSPVHISSLFPDQLIAKAEEEISRSEERRSSGHSHRRQGRFHPYNLADKSMSHSDCRSGVPAWKQIRDKQQLRKGRCKASTFSQKPAKGSKPRK